MKFKLVVDPDFTMEEENEQRALLRLADYFRSVAAGIPPYLGPKVEPVEPMLGRQEDDG